MLLHTGAKNNILSRNSLEFCEKGLLILSNMIFEKCDFLKKNEVLKTWILSKMGFSKCEFCQKWDFDGNSAEKRDSFLSFSFSFAFCYPGHINLESSYQGNYLWDMLAWGWCMTRMGTLDLPPTKGHWCVGGGGFSDVQITMIWNEDIYHPLC